MKPTNKNIAKFFGVSERTIATYKKERVHLYNALREYFLKMKKD